MGKVTADQRGQDDVASAVDNATHTFVADENTTFRKRRDPITLADMQVGDMIRARGREKNGASCCDRCREGSAERSADAAARFCSPVTGTTAKTRRSLPPDKGLTRPGLIRWV